MGDYRVGADIRRNNIIEVAGTSGIVKGHFIKILFNYYWHDQSPISAWNANLSAEEGERTRQEAIHELISTEKTYIDDLLLVVEVWNTLLRLCSKVVALAT